ncbi:hypothetical protein RB598_009440 [Gaeumannomyces tritici]
MESPEEENKKAPVSDQVLAVAEPSSSASSSHKNSKPTQQPAHPTMTLEEVMHELRTMQEHEHRRHMHFMSVYQPANRIGLNTLLPPPALPDMARRLLGGGGGLGLFGSKARDKPRVSTRDLVREMDLFHAEDCCNKSTAVYVLRQPAPASMDSGVAEARLRVLLIVVHAYLYKRWFEPYKSEVEWGRFVAKTIVPVIGGGSDDQTLGLGSPEADTAVARLHQAVCLASNRTRRHVARRHESLARLPAQQQQNSQLQLSQPSTPPSPHWLEGDQDPAALDDDPEAVSDPDDDGDEEHLHNDCHPGDDRQFRRQVIERGLEPARALLNKRNYVLQPLFRAMAITICLEDHDPERMRNGDGDGDGDAGAIPVRIVLFGDEDEVFDDDNYYHHPGDDGGDEDQDTNPRLSAPLSFDPIRDSVHDYREAGAGEHRTRSAATTLGAAASFVLAMAAREDAARGGPRPNPVEAGLDGEDGCLVGARALRREARRWGQPDVDVAGPSSSWVAAVDDAGGGGGGDGAERRRLEHHPDRARGAASDDEAWMARLEAGAYESLHWREGKLAFPSVPPRKKKREAKEESWVNLRDVRLW